MQKRRRGQRPPALSPYRSLIQIPRQYWDKVQSRDLADLCRFMPGRAYGPDGLIFPLSRRKFCWIAANGVCSAATGALGGYQGPAT